MLYRRNEYDVTNSVKTTDPRQVSEVVCLIYRDLYQQDTAGNLRQAFDDLVSLYRGEYPGYYGCDTDYHDIQHVMDVTLAMARLMDGCVRATTAVTIDERLFRFGIITALYHDSVIFAPQGYNTRTAPKPSLMWRAAGVLAEYLPTIGMATWRRLRRAPCTSPDLRSLDRIRGRGRFRLSATCWAAPTSWRRWPTAAISKNVMTGSIEFVRAASHASARMAAKSFLRQRDLVFRTRF